MPAPDVTIRLLGPDDPEDVRWTVVAAVRWDPSRELPSDEVLLAHPLLVIYHAGWGRTGDLGVAAERAGEVVGVAFVRRFTDAEHGFGYVDAETPEVAIAVRDDARGRGIGRRLLDELADAARAAGVRRLSLSVDPENPARRLYERAGYRVIGRDPGGGVLMLRDPV